MRLPDSRILGAALALLAFLPLSQGWSHLKAQQAFIANSVARDGVVVGLVPQSSVATNRQNAQLVPIVEFRDDNGYARRAKTNVASYPASHAIGEQLSVRVNANDNTDVQIASFAGMWLESLHYILPGVVALLVGILMALRMPLGRSKRSSS